MSQDPFSNKKFPNVSDHSTSTPSCSDLSRAESMIPPSPAPDSEESAGIATEAATTGTTAIAESSSKSRNPLKLLYNWVLSWAHSKYGTMGLAMISFAESSFFPIPPDILQIALSIERPKRSFYYAFVSVIASVFGAILGWYIGYALWGILEPYFIPHIISQANMDKVGHFFDEWGFWALFAAALTPIPFKAFTISAGVGGMALPILIIASLIGRGARFFIVGALFFFFGPSIKSWIDKYFGLLTFAFLILLILGFYSIKFLI